MSKNPSDKFSEAETQKRFEAALRGARIAGAKHKLAAKNPTKATHGKRRKKARKS